MQPLFLINKPALIEAKSDYRGELISAQAKRFVETSVQLPPLPNLHGIIC